MAKPTQTTEWCSDASYVEPTSGKKVVGFDPAERPPAQYLDWLFFTLELWIAWLDTITPPGADSEALSISSAGVLAADGKHGDRKDIYGPQVWNVDAAPSGSLSKTRISAVISTVTAGDTFIISAPMRAKVGDRIRSVVFYAGGSNDWDYQVVRVARDTGTETVVATLNSSAGGGEKSLAAIDHTVLEDFAYSLVIRHTGDGASADNTITYAEVTYDRP